MFFSMLLFCLKGYSETLTFSWQRPLSYRNQSIDLRSIYIYDNGLRHERVNLILKKQDFSTSISETSKNVCFYFMIGFLCSLYSYTIFLWWGIYPLELIKRRSKVQEKNMSRERALNFHQWKIFFENYKPVRAWLWLFNKFTYNDCCLQLFSKFIKLERGILPFLTKYASQLENYLSYEAKNFLVN